MQLINLKLINFLSHLNSEIPIENGVIGIFGEIENDPDKSNGAGKSSIVEAIVYGFYGLSRIDSEKSLIRENSLENMWVELEYENKENKYFIKRGRKQDNKPILEFKINNISEDGNTIVETNEKIIESLGGIDKDLFINSIIFLQLDSKYFLSFSPNERMDFIIKICQGEKFNSYIEDVLSKTKFKNNTLGILRIELGRLDIEKVKIELGELVRENDLTEKFLEKRKLVLEETNKKIELYEKLIYKKIGNIENRDELIKNLNGMINKLKLDLDRKSKEIEGLKKEINENFIIDFYNKKDNFNEFNLEKTEKDHTDLTKQNIILNEKIGFLLKTIKEKENDIEKIINLKECPVCLSEINEKKIKELNNKSKETIEKKQNELKVECKKSDEINTKVREIKEQIDLFQSFRNDKIEYEGMIKNKEKVEIETKEKKEIENQLLEYQSKLIQLNTDIYEADQVKLNRYKSELGKYKGNRQVYKEQVEGCQKKINENKVKTELLLVKIAEEKQLKENADQIKKQLSLLEESLQIFKKLKQIVISNNLIQFENITNQYLELLNFNLIGKIKFQPYKELSSKEKRNSLEIFWEGEKDRNIRLLSGGQKTIINIAIRLAIVFLIHRNYQINFDFLIFDETFGSVDKKYQSFILDLLKKLSESFKTILFITHLPINEEIDKKIIVSMKDEISYIK